MKEIVEYIAKSIVSHPDDVTVKSSVIVFAVPAGSVSALVVIAVEIVSAFKFAESIKKDKKR